MNYSASTFLRNPEMGRTSPTRDFPSHSSKATRIAAILLRARCESCSSASTPDKNSRIESASNEAITLRRYCILLTLRRSSLKDSEKVPCLGRWCQNDIASVLSSSLRGGAS